MTAMQFHARLAAETLPDNVRPGWTALLIVLAMGIALALLMWSMARQFRKIDFDEGDDAGSEAGRSQDDAGEPDAGEDDTDQDRDRDGHKANGSAPS